MFSFVSSIIVSYLVLVASRSVSRAVSGRSPDATTTTRVSAPGSAWASMWRCFRRRGGKDSEGKLKPVVRCAEDTSTERPTSSDAPNHLMSDFLMTPRSRFWMSEMFLRAVG